MFPLVGPGEFRSHRSPHYLGILRIIHCHKWLHRRLWQKAVVQVFYQSMANDPSSSTSRKEFRSFNQQKRVKSDKYNHSAVVLSAGLVFGILYVNPCASLSIHYVWVRLKSHMRYHIRLIHQIFPRLNLDDQLSNQMIAAYACAKFIE